MSLRQLIDLRSVAGVEFDGRFSITDIAKDVLKFAGKRNPVGLVSSVSGLLFDFDPVGDLREEPAPGGRTARST